MEKIKDNLPLFSVVIIGLGFIRLSTYYRYFNIKIIDYLQVSEVLTSFLDSLTVFVVLTVLILGYKAGLEKLSNYTQKNRDEEPVSKVMWVINKIEDFLLTFILPYIYPAIFIGLGLYVTYTKYETLEMFQFVLILFSGTIALRMVVKSLMSKEGFSYSNISFIGTILGFITVIIMIYGNIEAIETKEDYKRGKYQITLADTTFTTGKELVYVGKTEKYLFLFDTRTEASIAYPAETIKEVKYIPVEKKRATLFR